MTQQQQTRVRQSALAGERKTQRKAQQARAASLHEPHWFGLNMLDVINGLATDIRRLKRDKAAEHLNPEHRELIAAAALKLAPLLSNLPDLLRHPAAEINHARPALGVEA